MFRFCSVTTINPNTRRFIYKNMTWGDGSSMRAWLELRSSAVRLCLLYNTKLVTWASLSNGITVPLEVGAWTLEKYRRRGYAHVTIQALLAKHKISRCKVIQVNSEITNRIVQDLGYRTRF